MAESSVGASTTRPPNRVTNRSRNRLTRRQRARLIRFTLYALTIAVIAFVVAVADWGKVGRAFFQPSIFRDQFPEIVTMAAVHTVIFTALGFGGGLMIGLTLALMRLSTVRGYRWFAALYIEIFRGIPALITIIAIGFAIPIALGVRVPGRFGAGGLALAIVAGAYIAETIRAGIQAVPRGQMEAAQSLGMSYPRAMASIVIPQAFRIIIPPLTNELVLLLKDTSLLFVLGTTEQTIELTKYARDNVNQTFNITPLTVAALLYLAITLPLTRLVALLERRARRAR